MAHTHHNEMTRQKEQKAHELTRLQVYLLLSCCPAEGRISGIVDAPNACATLAIPLAIFDQVLSHYTAKIAAQFAAGSICMWHAGTLARADQTVENDVLPLL